MGIEQIKIINIFVSIVKKMINKIIKNNNFISNIFWLKYLKKLELKNKEFENNNLTTIIVENIIKNYKLNNYNILKSIEGYPSCYSNIDLNITQIEAYINLFKLYSFTEKNITVYEKS